MARSNHHRPPGLEESDKSYWHRYLDFYEAQFAGLGEVAAVLEFGVLDGRSIQWLAGRFPEARIVGCDILAPRPGWPTSPRIEYATVDLGSIEQLRALFGRFEARFDLIIDDGSHHPLHQRNCLVESISHLRDGGIYVLEDIHTSHPEHPFYQRLGPGPVIGPLHLLLALEHLKEAGADLDRATLGRLTQGSLFSKDEIESIHRRVDRIRFYRRAALPNRCYKCGGVDFDYATLRCRCGVDLYAAADSMSAAIHLPK